MKNNILLFVLVLAINLLTAPYFGDWYNQIDPQRGSWFWGPTDEEILFFVGFLMSYVFFIPLVFELLSRGRKNWWVIISLAPVILLFAGYKWQILYIPILIAIIGFGIAKLIRLIISKLHHTNHTKMI